MPIYEYECKQCHREFEYSQRMSDPEKTVCEACGGELARIISRTAFQLKGSGWYKDLYGSPKPADSGGGGSTKPGLAPPIGAHEGPPTAAEVSGKPEPKESSGSSSGGSSSGGSSSGGSSSGGGSAG